MEVEHIKHDLRAGKWGTPRDFKKAIAEYGQEQIVEPDRCEGAKKNEKHGI